MSDYRIVYSSDGSHLKDPKDAQNEPAIVPSEIELHLKRENKGRGGKWVIVITNFPPAKKYFKDLAKKLKKSCGVGGSFKNDRIEIQGDVYEKCKTMLEQIGF
jgi:translation initiation factor 1